MKLELLAIGLTLILVPLKVHSHEKLNAFMDKLKIELNFETLIVFDLQNSEATFKENEAVFITNVNNCDRSLISWFNSNFLVLVFMPKLQPMLYFSKLLDCLSDQRQAKIILYFSQQNPSESDEMELFMRKSQREFFPNVLMIFQNFAETNVVFSYTQFPQFKLLQQNLSEKVFPNRFEDLHGTSIRIYPTIFQPYLAIYEDKSKQFQLIGLLPNFFAAFAEKHNATIDSIKTILPYRQLQSMLKNNQIDMIMDLVPFSSTTSGVVEQLDLFAMIPYPSKIDTMIIYKYIIFSEITIFAFFLSISFTLAFGMSSLTPQFPNIKHQNHSSWIYNVSVISISALCNVMGEASDRFQGFSSNFTKVRILLFFSSIVVSTTYSAYFATYLAEFPSVHEISSLDELWDSNIIIKISDYQFNAIQDSPNMEDMNRIRKRILFVTNSTEFQKDRNSLDTRFGYFSYSSHWSLVNALQQKLPYPIFYLADKTATFKRIYGSISLQTHSIYRKIIDKYILQLHSSGILSRWQAGSLFDMIRAGEIKEPTVPKKPPFPLRPKHLVYVWILFGCGILLSFIIFLFEIFINKNQLGRAKS